MDNSMSISMEGASSSTSVIAWQLWQQIHLCAIIGNRRALNRQLHWRQVYTTRTRAVHPSCEPFISCARKHERIFTAVKHVCPV